MNWKFDRFFMAIRYQVSFISLNPSWHFDFPIPCYSLEQGKTSDHLASLYEKLILSYDYRFQGSDDESQ